MSVNTYTPSCKVSEGDRRWFLINAENLVLGRLASAVANILRGKNKAVFTPHNDCGDHVVIINAEKIFLSGNKLKDKVYYRHSGYPGGLKETTAGKILDGRFPDRVIRKAVERMIPDGPLGQQVLRKLHVYAGGEHPHSAQQPEVLDFAAKNSKNQKRG
ncbi:MAG: 50S ribosomal protein L13 [Holosporales bacterium]|nr:50S ribosomal protein L13 [Holosporales bacterium]